MSWVRIDDHAPEHPKLLKAGTDACWLWVCGLAWSSRHLTNGAVPFEAIDGFRIKRAARAADALVTVGLWEKAEDGFQVHDYLYYQPSREQVETKRERTQKRIENWRVTRGQTGKKRDCNAVTRPAPDPDPDPDPQDLKVPRASALDGFDAFWDQYPKRKSKGQAEKAWRKLKPSPELQEQILNAVDVQRGSLEWQKDHGQFVPYPATWLNAKGWEDDGVAQKVAAAQVDWFEECTRLHQRKCNGQWAHHQQMELDAMKAADA